MKMPSQRLEKLRSTDYATEIFLRLCKKCDVYKGFLVNEPYDKFQLIIWLSWTSWTFLFTLLPPETLQCKKTALVSMKMLGSLCDKQE